MKYILYVGSHVSSRNAGVSITKTTCEGSLLTASEQGTWEYTRSISSQEKHKISDSSNKEGIRKGNLYKLFEKSGGPTEKRISYVESRKLQSDLRYNAKREVMYNPDEEITIFMS